MTNHYILFKSNRVIKNLSENVNKSQYQWIVFGSTNIEMMFNFENTQLVFKYYEINGILI